MNTKTIFQLSFYGIGLHALLWLVSLSELRYRIPFFDIVIILDQFIILFALALFAFGILKTYKSALIPSILLMMVVLLKFLFIPAIYFLEYIDASYSILRILNFADGILFYLPIILFLIYLILSCDLKELKTNIILAVCMIGFGFIFYLIHYFIFTFNPSLLWDEGSSVVYYGLAFSRLITVMGGHLIAVGSFAFLLKK